ncbi:MAG: UDP-N-acetylglucosamine 2-epimerase (non-hydrolyzing) [Thermoguttaceae bacterium]|nr:UDP-N-acetylglucosamine 2-epimerase (non-hydrolyzing) [Thermoguttaceae bacterium]
MKIMTVLGTRPEIIRLSRIMAALDEYSQHVVVHTGQNYDYELSQIFFDDLALRKPDYFLNAAGASTASTVGSIISKMDEVFAAEKPDAVVVLGESNSCLGAYSAKRRKIPIFHVDAGKRSYDQRVPEEINRRLIDAIADVNLPCNSIARDNLLYEGFPIDRIFQIDSPMKEVFSYYRDKIESSDVLKRLGLRAGEYFVVSAHREENVDDPEQLQQLVTTLNNLAKYENKRVVFSVHPRTRKRLEACSLTLDPSIQALKPLGFFDYNALQRSSYAVLSDSGAIDEESTLLNFYALNLRHTRERYEIDDSPGAIMTGVEWERASDSLKIIKHKRENGQFPRLGRPWEDDHVSQKVAQIVVSYVDYVDRFVWHKK